MNCPKCNEETPVNKAFCVKCGGFIERGTGDVMEAVRTEVAVEARAAFLRKMGVWLATSIVILAGALAFRLTNRERDLPRFDETPVLPILEFEPPHPLPALDIPVTVLPVPPPAPTP